MVSQDDSTAREPSGATAGSLEGTEGDLAARTRERDLLSSLATVLVSHQTLDEALSSITRCLLDAGFCSGVRFYLYDAQTRGLVLRSTNGVAQSEGSREMVAIGEGAVGRVALSLQAVLLLRQEVSSQDELLFSTPTQEGARALMIVPLSGQSVAFLGAVVLQSEQPEVLAQLQPFIQQALVLAAAVIERVQGAEVLQRRVAAIAPLAREYKAGASRSLLARLALFTKQALDAEQCVVLLFDCTRGMLVLSASSPSMPGLPDPAPTLSLNPQMLDRLRDLSEAGKFAELSAYARARVNPLDHSGYQGLIVVPLYGERGWRGLLYCYYREERLPQASDQLVLPLIAMQAEAELGRNDLLIMLNQQYLLKSFFERLLARADDSEEMLHTHAAMLGMDLLHPFCLVLVEVGIDLEESDVGALRGEDSPIHPTVERIAMRLGALLRQDYPGSLQFSQGTILTCLVDVSASPSGLRLRDWLIEQHLHLSAESGMRLSIGLSTPCQSVGDFRRGFTEAGQALQLGPKISPDGGVVHWSDIRIFSYLTNFTTPQSLRDRYQELIEALARHDRTHHRKDRLLETLDAFLEDHGVVSKMAKRLGIHRNTAELRLKRIQEVTGVDLAGESLFDLQLALRTYKLKPFRVD